MLSRIIIGLVGQQGSGKDTVANYIAKQYGFTHVSTGDLIRSYMIANGLGPTTRDRIQATITRLRKTKGPDVLIGLSLENPAQRLVLSGLRHPAEGDRIRSLGGVIVAVLVDQRTRYNRAKDRGRVGDSIDFAAFRHLEDAENEKADPTVFNINALIEAANYRIPNNGTEAELFVAIDRVMQSVLKQA